MRVGLVVAFSGGLVGCAVAGVDSVSEVDSKLVTDQAVVDFVNSPETTFEVLRDQVHTGARAARQLADHVLGADGLHGTDDDQPFTTLAEIDAVPYVGPSALAALRSYVASNAEIVVETVPVTAVQAAAMVELANTRSASQLVAEVGLAATAASSLVAHRPFSDVYDVADAPQVGKTAITKLRAFAIAHPIACAAGTFDGVAFTASETCHALEFINKARYSQMGSISATARARIYDGQGPYRTPWQGLEQIEPWTSKTSMTALKAIAAAWTDDGLHHDTIANTWTNRSSLVGAPLTLERVYGARKLPMIGTFPNGFPEYCIELRDSTTGTNYLPACVTYINADSAPACADEGCADLMLHEWVWVRGKLEADSRLPGGYKIAVSGSARPRAANPSPP